MIGLPYYDYLSRSRVFEMLIAVVQIDEFAEALLVGSDAAYVDRLIADSRHYRHFAAVQESHRAVRDIDVFADLLNKVLLAVFSHVLVEHYCYVVKGYLIELIIRHL